MVYSRSLSRVRQICMLIAIQLLCCWYIMIFISSPKPDDPFNNTGYNFTLSIFTIPKPFSGRTHDSQFAVIESWSRLSVKPQIHFALSNDTILTDDLLNSIIKYNIKVVRVQHGANGVPMQNLLHAEASRANTTVTMVVNADIILLEDFLEAIMHIRQNMNNWLLVGGRYDIPFSVSPDFFYHSNWQKELRSWTLQNGVLHNYGGVDYFVWETNNDNPYKCCIGSLMPPFSYGRSKSDNWIVQMAINNGKNVVDATLSVVAIHQHHRYDHMDSNVKSLDQNHSSMNNGILRARRSLKTISSDVSPKSGSQDTKSKTKNFWYANADDLVRFNMLIAYLYGNYTNQQGTPLHAQWKLSTCVSITGEYMCLQRRIRPAICSCEHSSEVVKALNDPTIVGKSRKQVYCGALSTTNIEEYENQTQFAFERMVDQQVDKITNTIILLGVNFGYQQMLMNLLCRFQQLRIENYVVASFDVQMSKFCRKEGIPFFVAYDASTDGIDMKLGAAFGTQEFRKITKVKSRQVLRVLSRGYHVIWSDVDIFWLKNPIHHLLSVTKDIGIQSNAPSTESALNAWNRINSGFYLALSKPNVITAFQEIVQDAMTSKTSEQPSFYNILCHKSLTYRRGNDECFNPEISVHTLFLDRDQYPNGNVMKWEDYPWKKSWLSSNMYIVHNNWIKGHDEKQKRFIDHKLWLLDENQNCDWRRNV